MARKDRVESALREELATLLAREVKDPRVTAAGLIGVTRVECTPDLSVARVYVSIYADDAVAKKALAGLTASAGFLRGPVGRRLHLQRPPELRFVRDESAELNVRLASIIREDEAKAHAAGRGPDRADASAAAEATVDVDAAPEGDAPGAVDVDPAPADPAAADVAPDLDAGSDPGIHGDKA